jgi:hypothetical protein
VRLGDLVARQEVSLVLRLTFPRGEQGRTVRAIFRVTDAHGTIAEAETDRVWTFANHAANDAQPRNTVVDRAVAKLYAASARAEALELNRAGRFVLAQQRLAAVGRRIREYAGSDLELLRMVEQLRENDARYASEMSAAEMKMEYFQSYNEVRVRDARGKAVRRTP